jgi:2-oxoglutarate dehydrogenase complex dehydrogenase (E1) component-like enzyme
MIVMAPKNLLRHQKCRSQLSEFEDSSENGFQRLIKDVGNHKDKDDSIRRVVFCTGKVFLLFLETFPTYCTKANLIQSLQRNYAYKHTEAN